MKTLKSQLYFKSEDDVEKYANEQVLIHPNTTIVNVGIHFNNYGADYYSLWWIETTHDGNM